MLGGTKLGSQNASSAMLTVNLKRSIFGNQARVRKEEDRNPLPSEDISAFVEPQQNAGRAPRFLALLFSLGILQACLPIQTDVAHFTPESLSPWIEIMCILNDLRVIDVRVDIDLQVCVRMQKARHALRPRGSESSRLNFNCRVVVRLSGVQSATETRIAKQTDLRTSSSCT